MSWRERDAERADELAELAQQVHDLVVDLAAAYENDGQEAAEREALAFASLCRSSVRSWTEHARALRSEAVPPPFPMIVTRRAAS